MTEIHSEIRCSRDRYRDELCEAGKEVVIVGVGLGTSFCLDGVPEIDPGDCFQTLDPSDAYFRVMARQCFSTSCHNAKARKVPLTKCDGARAKYTILQFICKDGKVSSERMSVR